MQALMQDAKITETSRTTAPITVCDYCETVFEPRILNGPNADRFCCPEHKAAWHKENKTEALAVVGTRRSMKELVDGTIRVQIDIDPQYRARYLAQFSEIGIPVGLISLNLDQTTGKAKPQAPQKPFGQQAKALRLSGFLRMPEVWKALGTDDEYRAWVQKQPSAISGEFSEYLENGEGRCVAAHVRRIADGAGASIKNEYACIPLKQNEEHAPQHQHGESEIGGKDWCDKMRIKYVETWAWERLRQELQVESIGNADPKWVRQWAEERGLDEYLPQAYREA